MKKVLTLALSAALLLAMSVPAFAAPANLGNYVLSVDELETEEEAPAEAPSSQKENPNTGALLGNYVLAVDELEAEEAEDPAGNPAPAENPNTGAVSNASALLAAGSLAAALALLRRR